MTRCSDNRRPRQQIFNPRGSVNNALYAITFATLQPVVSEKIPKGSGVICRHCQEPDHSSADCALAIAQNLDWSGRGAVQGTALARLGSQHTKCCIRASGGTVAGAATEQSAGLTTSAQSRHLCATECQ